MSYTPIAIPGQRLGPKSANNVGPGTHIHADNLIASLAGPLSSTPSISKSSKTPTVSIFRPLSATTNTTSCLLPEVGTIVLGIITRTTPRQAHVSILALGAGGAHACGEALPGLIRQQDIRATETDTVRVAEMFRVGDVVRAAVISLGDERSYYLSTARDELGVVMAQSKEGHYRMVPVSWREFRDLETGEREGRKVAKPV